MSRIGKQPVALPEGVQLSQEGREIAVKGPKGSLAMTLLSGLDCTAAEKEVSITPSETPVSPRQRAIWGMQRMLLANMVLGVSEGFTRVLEINGVGFRAQAKGKSVRLSLGFSHEVDFPVPEGIEIKCPKANLIQISGIDKQQVGQIAANIRALRPPEPYKGKGVKYAGEQIYRKEGKKK